MKEHKCPSCGTAANCTIEDGYCANGCHETSYCNACIQEQDQKRYERLWEYDPFSAIEGRG